LAYLKTWRAEQHLYFVGGVAMCLERRSLAGEPSLIQGCSMVHFVGKVFAIGEPTRPTQPSIHLGSVNE